MSSRRFMNIEREIEKYWAKNRIVEKALHKKGNRGKFYFLDGPPYVTNPIHVGTAWNKIIKDAVLRYKRMNGYEVWARPGYDTHGLPIEVMVEKSLKIRKKKQIIDEVGLERFNEECRKIVYENLNILTDQFSSLGVWMDWSNPYVTLTDDYISSIWWGVKKIYEKGLLKRERRVFHWCPRCETVLSDHEVAQGYIDTKSPSIYVKFPILRKEREYLLIWTTTPWTLPSNVAVMVHPDLTYVKIKLKRTNEALILLKSRLGFVVNEPYEIVDEFDGRRLEGVKYVAPLSDLVPVQKDLNRGHRVVLSDKYVSEEEGTGCVHVAPEHGKEDFEVAMENGLPHIILVNEMGFFTKDAGKYAGKYIFDADEEIISDLKEKELLYKRETIIHKYPHCWRCKTPLFLRSTEQWVIKLTELRDELLKANENIRW
ncbi:isoleucine--tRNA ligase, partial [Candidatus Geothermarchaeota archaeon]